MEGFVMARLPSTRSPLALFGHARRLLAPTSARSRTGPKVRSAGGGARVTRTLGPALPARAAASGVVAGEPGEFAPEVGVPFDLAEVSWLGLDGGETAWGEDEFVELGDGSAISWDGEAWVAWVDPEEPDVPEDPEPGGGEEPGGEEPGGGEG